MRHDEHRDVLHSVPVSVVTSYTSFGAIAALAASTSSASCAAIPASSVAVAAAACRDVANIAFRLVLDASPDGLPVLVWQRLPRCEQQRVLPSVRMEPRCLWRGERQCAHVRWLYGARSEREPMVRHDEHRHTLRPIPVSTRHAAAAATAAAFCATIALPPSPVAVAASALASTSASASAST